MNKIEVSRLKPIRDVVYEKIRKAILSGDLRPGERLMEETLARDMGISRTPVREALRKLEVENMVSHNPNKGVVITSVSVDEAEDLYNIRMLLDSIIARRAAQNAKAGDIRELEVFLDKAESAQDSGEVSEAVEAYNDKLSSVADCQIISDLARQVRENLSRMILSTYLKPDRRKEAQREHREIVAAIAAKDGELAKSLTERHIKNAQAALANLQKKGGE